MRPGHKTKSPDEGHDKPKQTWVKPEITDFKPISVARGVAIRIGDGISNLS